MPIVNDAGRFSVLYTVSYYLLCCAYYHDLHTWLGFIRGMYKEIAVA